MSSTRPTTWFVPLGLFCQATISGALPLVNNEHVTPPSGQALSSAGLDGHEAEITLRPDGLDEDNYWDDDGA